MHLRPIAPVLCVGRSLCIVSLALLFAGTAALAAPDDNADPVMRLLAERHVIETPAEVPAQTESKLLRQVRERASEMVLTALNSVGVRYRSGGNSEASGFDCSGFTRFVFGTSLGLALPRRADEQASAPGLVQVKREDLQPGDLVFFNTLKRTFSHVGIYIGDNRFVHAPRPGGEVRTEDMGFAYWKKRYTGARRAELVTEAKAPLANADSATTTLR
jgi:cell wall-associated NlpC family hydrolase